MHGLAGGVAALGLLLPTVMTETVSPLSAPAVSTCQAPAEAGAAGSAAQAPARPVLLEGFGSGGFTVTENTAAQRWFDQGMAAGFAFSHRETLRAFEEAQRLDPRCAMCAWGEAWARGPTINFGVDRDARTKALAALDRVSAYAGDLQPKHQALISALRVRYAQPANADRKGADRAYAGRMEALAAQHPEDDEIAVWPRTP